MPILNSQKRHTSIAEPLSAIGRPYQLLVEVSVLLSVKIEIFIKAAVYQQVTVRISRKTLPIFLVDSCKQYIWRYDKLGPKL